MNRQTLVAVDWADEGLDPAPVAEFLGDALIEQTSTVGTGHRPRVTHRFVFDATKIRNTEAHGAGYRAGFVVHLETT